MAGDVQHPFHLTFQIDCVHSGSVSFGRFELDESLSWEKRSYFSHNRYLEEAVKYARPGSVAEKKAFLEAHFRRKSLLRQFQPSSEVDQVQKPSISDENVDSITTISDELPLESAQNPIDLKNEDSSCEISEEDLKGESQFNYDLMDSEVVTEECISQCTEAIETIQDLPSMERIEEKSRGSGVKSRLTDRPEMMKETAQSCKSGRQMKNQKKMPQFNGSLQSSLRISKKENSQCSKGKVMQEIGREKEARPKRGVILDPSTPERMESRKHPLAARIKQIAPSSGERKRCVMNPSFRSEIGEKTKEMKPCLMTCSFRSERAEKTRQDKKESETIESAKKLVFKARPMPSFYHQTPPKGSSANKPGGVANRGESTKTSSKCSSIKNQTGLGSMLCSKAGKNDATASSKRNSTCSKFEAHCSSNPRNMAAKARILVQKR